MTVSVMPEKILPPMSCVSADALDAIKNCGVFKEIDYFSALEAERRHLIRRFYPLPPHKVDRNLIVLKGKSGNGSTWLGKWLMEVCALLDHDIRYIEVAGLNSPTWLDVLLQIRDGYLDKDIMYNSSRLIYDKLEKSAFYEFNWNLDHHCKEQKPPVWDGSDYISEADIKNCKWTPNYIEDLSVSFRKAIVGAAKVNKPLIIVLDEFAGKGELTENDMNILVRNLFEPAARGELKEIISDNEMRAVKFVLIFSEEEFDKYKIKNSFSSSHEVSISSFDTETFSRFFSEYLNYRLSDTAVADQQKIQDIAKNIFEKDPNISLKKLFEPFEKIFELMQK